MKHLLFSRLLAGFGISVSLLAPVIASAQDAAMADNSSPVIGFLVVWLLAIGGIIAVAVAISVDKMAQSSRTKR
jgi:hypothetical protein